MCCFLTETFYLAPAFLVAYLCSFQAHVTSNPDPANHFQASSVERTRSSNTFKKQVAHHYSYDAGPVIDRRRMEAASSSPAALRRGGCRRRTEVGPEQDSQRPPAQLSRPVLSPLITPTHDRLRDVRDQILTTDHVVSHDVINDVTSLADNVTDRLTSSIKFIFLTER